MDVNPSLAVIDGTASVIPNAPPTPTPPRYAGNLDFEARSALQDRLCGLAGYSAPKTIFAPGTPLIDIGERNLARERARLEALPTVEAFGETFDAAEALRDVRDLPATLAGLRMLPTGKIQRLLPEGDPRRGPDGYGPDVAVTPTGLAQLIGLHREALDLPTGIASTIQWALQGSEADRADGAQLFNQIVRRAQGENLTTPRIFRVACRIDTGEAYLFAVTSPKHVGVKGGYRALVRAIVRRFAGTGAKVQAVHQGHDRLDLQIVFPMCNREIRVGDLLWGTLSVTISEAKDVSASVADSVCRVLCVNLTRADFGKEAQFSRKHIGETFVRELAARMAESWNRLQPFVAAFGDSYRDALPSTRAETVERLVKAHADAFKALPAPAILAAWDMDGERGAGDTRGGLVNALTRASQSLGISDAQEVERVAGGLVSQGWRVLN